MSLNPANCSCGGCQQLREELEGLKARVASLEAHVPLSAVPEWLTAPDADDRKPGP